MARAPETPAGKICLGVVIGAQGVQGAVRVKFFTAEPANVAAYGRVSDETGMREFDVTLAGKAKNAIVLRLSGIDDRNAAEALKGMHLYVDRTTLPEPEEDEFYYSDLVGLEAVQLDGANLGVVRQLGNYGAGETIEIETQTGGLVVLPFTRAVVPVIDLEAGRIVVDPPPGLLTDDENGADE